MERSEGAKTQRRQDFFTGGNGENRKGMKTDSKIMWAKSFRGRKMLGQKDRDWGAQIFHFSASADWSCCNSFSLTRHFPVPNLPVLQMILPHMILLLLCIFAFFAPLCLNSLVAVPPRYVLCVKILLCASLVHSGLIFLSSSFC